MFISRGTCAMPSSIGGSSHSESSFSRASPPPSAKLARPPLTFLPASPSHPAKRLPRHHSPCPVAMPRLTSSHCKVTSHYLTSTSSTSAPFTPSICCHRLPPASRRCQHHHLIFFLHLFRDFASVASLQYPYLTMNLSRY